MRHRNGSVLVIVLWIVIILIMITAVLAQSSRLSSRISQSYSRQNVCRWGARAAIETAINVLSADDTGYDAFDELWHDDPEDLEEIQLEGCVASVEIVDECSKLNVNTAGKKHFVNLLEMTAEQADSILDWRDNDGDVSTEGAEAEYYNHRQYPYPIRNGPFQTLHEVLLVKGINEDVFYREDYNLNGKPDANEKDGDQSFPPDNQDAELEMGIGDFLTCWSFCRNVDAGGKERINISEANADKLRQELNLPESYAKWIAEKANGKNLGSIAELIDKNTPKQKSKEDEKSDEPKQIDLQTFKEIADKITLRTDKVLYGVVNINTASAEVLTALLEGDERLADEIIKHRDGLETPMTDITGLLDVKSMTLDTFKKIAGMITVRSDVFSLRAHVADAATGFDYTTTAVVTRNGDSCDIIYWYEGMGN